MEINRMKSVAIGIDKAFAKLFKSGAKGVKAATDATADEIAYVNKWAARKLGQPLPTAKTAVAAKASAKPAAKRTARVARKALKGDTYTNSKGVTYRKFVVYLPVE